VPGRRFALGALAAAPVATLLLLLTSLAAGCGDATAPQAVAEAPAQQPREAGAAAGAPVRISTEQLAQRMRSAGADPAAVTAMLARTAPAALAERSGSVAASGMLTSETSTGVAVGADISSAIAKRERNISFDDRYALSNVLDKAFSTFALWTKRDASGNLAYCHEGNAAPPPNCWVYRETFDPTSNLEVWPIQGSNHYHLFFENEPVKSNPFRCELTDAQAAKYGSAWGLPQNRDDGTGHCSGVYWDRWPRELVTMYPTDWIQVTLENGRTGQLRKFDLANLLVTGEQPIQLWFRASDGSVQGYNRLEAGQDWRLEFLNIYAVWISAVADGKTGISIGRLLVRG
jgi:hypothetical protein